MMYSQKFSKLLIRIILTKLHNIIQYDTNLIINAVSTHNYYYSVLYLWYLYVLT